MRQNRLYGKLARHLAMRFSAHSVGEDVKLQAVVNGIAILVVFTDAPKIGARAGLNVQRGLARLVPGPWLLPLGALDRGTRPGQGSPLAGPAGPVKFRLAKRYWRRNGL